MGYVPEKKDFYTTDEFATYAIDRLEEYKNEDKPFLLYLPFTAPHYPLHAWPADIAKYRGKYRIGWDELRKRRYARQVEMGIIDAKYAASPRDPKVPAWDTLTDEQKDKNDLLMAVYVAMVDRMDQAIGRVLKKVEQLGKSQNTLVIFLADNGGCAENVNTTPNTPPGPVESYRTVGPAWANASNTPYRKYKATDYEGGNCTPFIASWPGVIKPGTMTDQVGHIIDMLFWQYGKGKAIRQGKWKLVRYDKADWELYDLDEDRTELNNVAKEHPGRVKQMTDAWQSWLDVCKR